MSVPIPGEILKSDIIFGLSFDELVGLGTIPLVLILPTVFFDFIPLWVTGGVLIIGTIGVMGIILKSPRGQSPVEWFPAYLDRRLKPDRYTLKPKDQTNYGKPEVKYVSMVHTADEIEQEVDAEFSVEEFRDKVSEIEHAEKLELPEWAQEEEEDTQNRLAVDILLAVKDAVMYNRVTAKVFGAVSTKTE